MVRLVSPLRVLSFRALPLPAVVLSVLAAACGGSGGKGPGAADDPDGGPASTSDGAASDDAGSDGGASAAVDTNTGSACSADDECSGGGTNRCLTTVQEYEFPRGYCTTTCEADEACGDAARCPLAPLLTSPLLPLLPGNVQSAIREFSSCFRTCTVDDDCRVADGYHCGAGSELFPTLGSLGVDTSARYCLPPAPSMLDAGTRADAGSDAGVDAGADAGPDSDAGVDAGLDGDAGEDAGLDAAGG